MNVALNPDLKVLVNQKVRSGEFPSAEAVVEEGLRLLKARDQMESRLKLLLLESEESGPASEMTAREWEGIRREAYQARRNRGTP